MKIALLKYQIVNLKKSKNKIKINNLKKKID